MFKVSEVAEMLSVEKVKIFEALIVHDAALSPFVSKERHITFISEKGVRALEALLFNHEDIEIELEDPSESDEQLFEEDHLDLFIKKNNEKKSLLRNEIIDLKRQLSVLDKELRKKDEAILGFQEIIKEDLLWAIELESKIGKCISQMDTSEDDKKNGFFNRLMK